MMASICARISYDNTTICVADVVYVAVRQTHADDYTCADAYTQNDCRVQVGPGQPQVLTEASKLSTSTAS